MVGKLGHVSILLPESQGDASTKIKKDTSLRNLGNGAANLRDKGRDMSG